MHDAPAVLQVELEKLYDKHDKTQMEMRKVHGELEKYKNETASLEAEVKGALCNILWMLCVMHYCSTRTRQPASRPR